MGQIASLQGAPFLSEGLQGSQPAVTKGHPVQEAGRTAVSFENPLPPSRDFVFPYNFQLRIFPCLCEDKANPLVVILILQKDTLANIFLQSLHTMNSEF